MSEAQAKETEIEIEIEKAEDKPEGFTIEPEVEETVIKADETIEVEEVKEEVKPEIEIKVEEAGEPPARRLSRFDKRIKSKTAEVEAANAETEALREQVRLYQLRDQQAETLNEPDEDTFEGSETELKAAHRAYNHQEVKRIAGEQAQIIVEKSLQNTTQASQELETDVINAAHYDRSDTLPISASNYNELEGNAVDILGDDFAQVLISSTDNAHLILASMGANSGKTAKIAKLVKSNPAKAFADALMFEIHPSLKPVSKTTLDPETTVDPGQGITSSEPGLEGVKFE